MRELAFALAFAAAAAPAWAQSFPEDAGAPLSPSDDLEIAKAHFATGQAYYERQRFADAAREFEEAYRLAPKPALLYNIGKSYDGGNDFARALDAYLRFLRAAPADSTDRPFVQKRVEILSLLVGQVTLQGAVPGSAVTFDGKPAGTTPLEGPIVTNPGPHRLALTHDGYATFRANVDVPVGRAFAVSIQQTESVKVVTVLQPAEKEKPVYKKWWLWAALGGAVAAAGVVTAVVLTSGSSNSSVPTVQLPQVR